MPWESKAVRQLAGRMAKRDPKRLALSLAFAPWPCGCLKISHISLGAAAHQ
jgi:hypothetical protein